MNIIEKIDTFIDRGATVADVTLYYLFHMPYVIILTLPAAVLIGTIFTVGQCNRWHELTAMKASGLSLYRILLPLFIAAGVISTVVLLAGETVLPHTNEKTRSIYDHQILKKADRREVISSLRYQGKRGVLYSIDNFRPDEGRMDQVTLVKESPSGKLVYRVDARRGEWKGDHWLLKDGYLRYFNAQDEETTYRFGVLTSRDLEETPEDFTRRNKDPEDMTYLELSRYIDSRRRGGGDTLEDEVYLRLKLAFPFANLIIVLFGAPLATISRKGGTAANFGVSLLVFILFWGFIHISRAIGESGAVSPLLSAWMANIIFGLAGLGILIKVRK